MKTTLNIDDTVMQQLKEEAARHKTTMSALVESALRLHFKRSATVINLPPLPTFDSGGHNVDVTDRHALSDLFDADKDAKLHGRHG